MNDALQTVADPRQEEFSRSPELAREAPAYAESGTPPASSLELPPSSSGWTPGRFGTMRLPATAVRSRSLFGFGLVILAALCWSTSGIFITRIIQGGGIAPLSLAFWRVAVTFGCLFVTLLIFRRDLLRVSRRDLPWLAGMGALAMGTFQVLWILSVLYNGLSIATVIQCNAPVIVTLLAWVFWREPLTWRKWIAIVLAALGTLLVSGLTRSSDLQLNALGMLIALGSALGYAGITLFAKKLTGLPGPRNHAARPGSAVRSGGTGPGANRDAGTGPGANHDAGTGPGANHDAGTGYNSWTILMYGFGFAALALLPFQFGRPLPQPAGWEAYGSFAALVLVPTIAGYTLYTLGLRHLQASVASITAMAEVPFAAFNGYVFLGERLDALQALGAIIVMGGVALLSWRPKGAGR